MANLLTDGIWSAPSPIGVARLSAPIPGVATDYLLEQDYWIDRDSYAPLALNTAHPDLPTYYLVSESELMPIGIGTVKFTRTYSQVPATHNELETVAYSFIGFAGSFIGTNIQTATGRERFSRSVRCKVVNDYWIANGTSQSAVTINTQYDIPFIPETLYVQLGSTVLFVDYLKDSPPWATASVPSRATYEGWVASDAGGDNWHIVTDGGSRYTRWKGNIFQRQTRYIKAL